jgi:ATP-binding cassette subfamily B protein
MYHDSSVATLHDINIKIQANTKVAIMGPTGSGKSSLIHLLNRIYDPTSGTITIDGINIKDINKSHLRKNVQIVLQEPFLYSKTIKDNIGVATNADLEEIRNVAQSASIDHVIESFDLGYETEVGEKGVTLSGGQKQRVAIARSLMLKSPIVVFDDSLSALDSKTDAAIQKSLNELDYPVTTLMITHRINTARNADQIIVLDEGSIVQCGTHEELISQDGIYKRIYEIQSEGGDSFE